MSYERLTQWVSRFFNFKFEFMFKFKHVTKQLDKEITLPYLNSNKQRTSTQQ